MIEALAVGKALRCNRVIRVLPRKQNILTQGKLKAKDDKGVVVSVMDASQSSNSRQPDGERFYSGRLSSMP